MSHTLHIVGYFITLVMYLTYLTNIMIIMFKIFKSYIPTVVFFQNRWKILFQCLLELLRLRFERFQGYMRFSFTFIYASTADCYKFYYSTMNKNVKNVLLFASFKRVNYAMLRTQQSLLFSTI